MIARTHLDSQSQKDYLRDWLSFKGDWISKILAKNAPQENRPCVGRDCSEVNCRWRCRDCLGEPAYCDQCCAKEHHQLPFHRVEAWKGTHYSPAWLWQAGVCIFLGHRGLPCPNIQPVGDDDMDGVFLDQEFQDILMSEAAPPGRTWMQKKVITVVHTNGVHHLPVGLCGCPDGMSEIDGYIELGLLPSTFDRVQTVFTFQVGIHSHTDWPLATF